MEKIDSICTFKMKKKIDKKIFSTLEVNQIRTNTKLREKEIRKRKTKM